MKDEWEELGIPLDAEKVLFLVQHSHCDPDWMNTLEGYYREGFPPSGNKPVKDIIKRALDYAGANKKFKYVLDQVCYLKYFWDHEPSYREKFKKAVKNKQIEICGGSYTQPDTILITGESLWRDFLIGKEWLKKIFNYEPKVAWQLDPFGHGAEVPQILLKNGCKYLSLARIDSRNEERLKKEKAIQFYLEGIDGSKILTYLQLYHYNHGKYLLTCKNESEFFERIGVYVKQLLPYTPTDFLMVPVGDDFRLPSADLPRLVDQWNKEKFEETKIWCLAENPSLFFRLIETQKDRLKTFKLDLNPYWTGFYIQRPQFKAFNRKITYKLTAAEKFSTLASLLRNEYPFEEFAQAWEKLVFNNHHDSITGTSPDWVNEKEILPNFRIALQKADKLLERAISQIEKKINLAGSKGIPIIVFNQLSYPTTGLVTFSLPSSYSDEFQIQDEKGKLVPSQVINEKKQIAFLAVEVPPIGWKTYWAVKGKKGKRGKIKLTDEADLILENRFYRVTIDKQKGYLKSVRDKSLNQEVVANGSNDLTYWDDNGGIYRIGSELFGKIREVGVGGRTFEAKGKFAPLLPLSGLPSKLKIREHGEVFIEVEITTQIPREIKAISSKELSKLLEQIKGIKDQPPLSEATEQAIIHPKVGQVIRDIVLYRDLPRIDFKTRVKALPNTTVTARFQTGLENGKLMRAIPYGAILTPFEQIYSPTFWPVLEWVDLSTKDFGVGILNKGCEGWNFDQSGGIKFGLTRCALFEEQAGPRYGPWGTDLTECIAEYSLTSHPKDKWIETALKAYEFNAGLIAIKGSKHKGFLPSSFSFASSKNALITTIKRGSGKLVIRVFNPSDERKRCFLNLKGVKKELELMAFEIRNVFLSERDL
jgi:alpha-mannosidase